jgi:hypothetical protein
MTAKKLLIYLVKTGYLPVNERAGRMGLISDRKAFHRSMKEVIEILNAIQHLIPIKTLPWHSLYFTLKAFRF